MTLEEFIVETKKHGGSSCVDEWRHSKVADDSERYNVRGVSVWARTE